MWEQGKRCMDHPTDFLSAALKPWELLRDQRGGEGKKNWLPR